MTPSSSSPSPSTSLDEALEKHAFELTRAMRKRLQRYCRMLWDANQHLNLTRHTDWDVFVSRDLTDVMQLSALLDRPEMEILDIGSGGGIPGVVLAIVRPDLRISVCDSTQKKARVLQEMVTELELPVTVHAERAESVLEDDGFDACTARAVGPIWKLLTWLNGHWPSIRRLYAFKGPRWQDELAVAKEKGLTRRLIVKAVARYPLVSTDRDAGDLESVIVRMMKDVSS